MRTAALIPALANGHIDYTMSFLPPIDSALRGVPMQMLAVFVDRSLHYLVTRPTVKSGADLPWQNLCAQHRGSEDRKSTRLNSSHGYISYAVFCLKKKKKTQKKYHHTTSRYTI